MLSAPLRARALLQRTTTTRLSHQAVGFQQLRLSRPTSIVAAPGVALPAASATITKRSMASSTAAAPLQEWLVIAPDFKGALEKRLSVREQHLSDLKQDDESFWLWGGAMLEEPLAEGVAPKMSGSAMLIGAKTKEEVIERLKRDKYVSNEVWDWEKVQIIPFKSALRKPL